MTTERSASRGVVLAEDRRTERFVRVLLGHLGFDCRRIRFLTAPSGRGAAEAWVRKQYPAEVQVLRSKRHQRGLFLVAVRDGDSVGCEARKQELDDELVAKGHPPRQSSERIATPAPTWSIETWLLALLGDELLDEGQSYKNEYRGRFGGEDRQAIARAVESWSGARKASEPPSLLDGLRELDRLAPS